MRGVFLWLIFVSMLAFGDAEERLVRQEDRVQMRRYDRLTTSNPPRAFRRTRSGRYRVWSWRDGTIEHLEEWNRRTLVRRQYFGVSGTPFTSVFFQEGAPQKGVAHGVSPVEVDVHDWVEWSLGPARFLLPSPPDEQGQVLSATGSLRLTLGPAVDVFSDAPREALRQACGCVLEDRTTTWVDGHVAVRYRLRFPHPTQPRSGEVWMVPTPQGLTLYIAAITQEVISAPGDLATARVVVSLLSLEKAP